MPSPESPASGFTAADRNVRLFVAFRILFNARFYYPVFMVMFLDFGITVEEFAMLNAVWAAAIVLLEVPSGALADLVGRRRLVIAGAALMVAEMLVLVLVPVPSVWVWPALVANRIVSGTAEAFISGADEALAFDSLAACGRAAEWPRVLERLVRWGGVVTMFGMVTGSLVYDPGMLDRVAASVGGAGGFSRGDTFRLPIWLTLGSATLALAAAVGLQEPPRTAATGHGVAAGPLAAFRQTAATARWILAQPLVLLVIAAGVLVDLPIRQVLVVSSEIYEAIGIPTPAFGLVSAASALVGLTVAVPLRRLALETTARRNGLLLAAVTLTGLVGTAVALHRGLGGGPGTTLPWPVTPLGGITSVILLSMTLRMVMVLQSHYLNQLVDAGQRATVLSFRGLAVNVAYGLGSIGFAAATAAIVRAGGGDASFRIVVSLLPAGFLLACGGFACWTRWLAPNPAPLVRPGGFGP